MERQGMDLFNITSGTQKFAHFGLRKYDPLFYSYKSYRDSVISSNLLRKATQLVAQIEAARVAPKNPVEELLKRRGNILDTKS